MLWETFTPKITNGEQQKQRFKAENVAFRGKPQKLGIRGSKYLVILEEY